MSYCSQCDNQYPDHHQFCPDCGQRLQANGQGADASQQNSGRNRGQSPPSRGGQAQHQQRQQSRSRGEASRSADRRQQAARSGGEPQPSRSPDEDASGVVSARKDQVDLIGRDFFGEYTIVDRLGEGGMGAVYLAEQNSIDQKIALKVLHAESAESDEVVQRFHREAKVISMLAHPNIVRVFIFGRTDDDLLFLAMEFVEGIELREKLDGTPVDELMAIKVMKQVCSAVAAAHDHNIIHRDLKPENILLTTHRGEDNYVKILDFGIAKLKHPDGQQGPQLTQAGIVYGTPEYLSPEQAQADDLDHRTDIYALGCILFEMLTGQVPFDAESSVEILKQKVFQDPPKPSDFAPVAPTMEELILTAMAQDRDHRFDDALEMFDALVVREQELQQERQLDRRETYVPGSELTGHHQLEALQEATQEEAADQSGAVAAGSQDVDGLDDTVATAVPSNDEISTPGADPADQQRQQRRQQRSQAQHQQQQQHRARAPNTPQQGRPQPDDGQPDLVRYALLATVVVLAVAVTALFVYLVTILAG